MGICIKCGKPISSYNPSDLCWACQEKNIYSMVESGGPNYTLEDMRVILGFQSDTQVKRMWAKGSIPGRIPGIKKYLFHKQTVDEWVKSGGIIPKQPTNPIQHEAYERCKKNDHSWLHDERFEGHVAIE